MMRDHFDRFFSGKTPRIRRVPGSQLSGKLLEDQVLEVLLNRLDELSSDSCYPLQLSFYEKLLHCDLLLPVPVGTNLQQGLPIITLENARGEMGLPIFTNENTLGLWDEEPTEYIILSFPKLCGYALEAQVDFMILNVAGPNGCEIAMRDFSYLAEGLLPPPVSVKEPSKPSGRSLPVEINAGTPTCIGPAQNLPESLMGRLNHVFSMHHDAIERVYQFEIAFNQGPLQPAIGVLLHPQVDEACWEENLWPTVRAVLQEMLERRTMVNIFLLNHVPSLEKQVRAQCPPVFVGSPVTEK
jgi:hypothetical protein